MSDHDDEVIDLTEPTDLTDAQTDRLAEILTNEILRTNHEAANHILWFTNRGGYAPGSFTASLLDCFDRADDDDRVRLATVYPEYGWAVDCARRNDWDALHHAANHHPDTGNTP